MHDLACELGMTAGALAREMTEVELSAWERYAARRMLPGRRIEMYLAQIAQMIVAVNGGKTARLADFMFGESTDESTAIDAESVGFKPRNRG